NDITSRKRVKTAEEKGQRSIERILRNRAAAQSSRERKVRLSEVEESNKSLHQKLGEMERTLTLYEEHMKVEACGVAS
ncbi:hypothetical protein HOY82DRAFT_452802, partial [Tuber indicum]